ncbi:hypothetical protein AWV80_22195 [Cupriavidus sp. UYMU48A]|nr:hypothetical protein AWV80_22195 [Cupriavidus sp. UYMU48A]
MSNILDPLKSRFSTLVELEPTIEDWTRWAVTNNVSPVLIAFLRFRPDLLLSKDRSKEVENLPSPRGWGHVARQLPVVPPGMEIIATAGAVGEGAALEFESFRQIYRELPSVDSVLAARNPPGSRTSWQRSSPFARRWHRSPTRTTSIA